QTCALPIWEPQQVPVGIGDHHVLGLPAHPAAHVDIAVGAAGTVRVHVQTDLGAARLAHLAAAAGDVEGDRDQVAFLDELHARPVLDDLAGDLVAEHEAFGGGGAAADHVLVRAADVGGDDLQDRRMGELAADVRGVHPGTVLQLEGRVVDVDDVDLPGALVGDRAVAGHGGNRKSTRLNSSHVKISYAVFC